MGHKGAGSAAISEGGRSGAPTRPSEPQQEARGSSAALDAELRSAFEGFTPPDYSDLQCARAEARVKATAAPSSAPDVSGKDHLFLSSDSHTVRMRVYRPGRSAGALPGVLWIHGGGFVLGGIEESDRYCRTLAAALPATVASIEYRLAPEHVFPAALDDCWAAWMGLLGEAARLEIDPTRVAVAGSSAGAGLAAALCLLARDGGGPQPCFQLLLHPLVDDRIDDSAPETKVFTRERARAAWRHYLGRPGGGADTTPYAAPARAASLHDLPPAYVLTAEFDLVRDAALAFGSRLVDAAVPAEIRLIPGAFHSFEAIAPDAEISRRTTSEYTDALRAALREAPTR